MLFRMIGPLFILQLIKSKIMNFLAYPSSFIIMLLFIYLFIYSLFISRQVEYVIYFLVISFIYYIVNAEYA